MSRHEYFAAVLPEPHTLLGVRLRPFSLGHILHLNRTENAFAIGTQPTLADLVAAVFICSQTFAEFADVLNTGTVLFKKRWRTTELPLADAMREWQKAIGNFDITEKAKAFASYMEAGCNHPYIMVRGPAARPSPFKNGCPFVQVVKAKLQSEFGLSDAEIVDRAWGLCLWDFFTLRMFDGALDIVDEDTTNTAIDAAQKLADELQRRIDAGEVKYG